MSPGAAHVSLHHEVPSVATSPGAARASLDKEGPSIVLIAPPGTGKSTYLLAATSLSFGTRAAHHRSLENRLRLVPGKTAAAKLEQSRERLLAEGTFPDATHDHDGLSCYLFSENPQTGENTPYPIETVDTTGGAFQNLGRGNSESSMELLELLRLSVGMVLLVDVRNLGEGARAIEHVLGAGIARLHAQILEEARLAGRTGQVKVDKNLAVVVAKADRLVTVGPDGNYRFKRRPLLEHSRDREGEAELCDLPDTSLDLQPYNVRTYLLEHCGQSGKRLVETLERAFFRVSFFAASAVGLTQVGTEWIANVKTVGDQPKLRSAHIDPFGLIEPFAWALDPLAIDRGAPAQDHAPDEVLPAGEGSVTVLLDKKEAVAKDGEGKDVAPPDGRAPIDMIPLPDGGPLPEPGHKPSRLSSGAAVALIVAMAVVALTAISLAVVFVARGAA